MKNDTALKWKRKLTVEVATWCRFRLDPAPITL
jgi:hypothetical protein